MAPSLRTRRLLLSPVTETDVPWLTAHWNTAEVGRFLWDGQPVAEALAREQVQRSLRDFQTRGFGLFLVRRHSDGAPLGFAGLRFVDELSAPELLYSIEPSAWRTGVATEAGAACLHFGFGELGLERIVAGVDAPNRASSRVLEKLGMRPYRVVMLGDVEAHYSEASRAELARRFPVEALGYERVA
ncbi:MAG TPA: GNAT family N-acetyltransferase [Myxococcaceae bacterium]|nr:GNAT family N-acetyltransferase [Myxococcaceae bacterium]